MQLVFVCFYRGPGRGPGPRGGRITAIKISKMIEIGWK